MKKQTNKKPTLWCFPEGTEEGGGCSTQILEFEAIPQNHYLHACVPQCMSGNQENYRELVLSFHHISSGNQTQHLQAQQQVPLPVKPFCQLFFIFWVVLHRTYPLEFELPLHCFRCYISNYVCALFLIYIKMTHMHIHICHICGQCYIYNQIWIYLWETVCLTSLVRENCFNNVFAMGEHFQIAKYWLINVFTKF